MLPALFSLYGKSMENRLGRYWTSVEETAGPQRLFLCHAVPRIGTNPSKLLPLT
jgi:hypothetical protein